MKKTVLAAFLLLLTIPMAIGQGSKRKGKSPAFFRINNEQLKDKIKGGWAGQTIGVTFGWPTEFVFQGTYIQDYQAIKWYDDYVNEAMSTFPGLFDDVYMDLTFMEVFERLGLDAPADSFAVAYATKNYELWHANQAGRYNILQGLRPPVSGHWLNNPHADDIDFQIEADFAGLMSPAMPNVASAISDKIGHIMNYGDGWYGGVLVANMYANAFRFNQVAAIVEESVKSIPLNSRFYQCMTDVIAWHKRYPDDWKRTWFEIQRKWSEDAGCPFAVLHPINIDAKLNSAYVLLGLLYGKGDFSRTMEIATRAGQDSDCNPSTAGGILGTMLGYSRIPEYWLTPLKRAEGRKFSHTSLSLSSVYELGFKHALTNVKKNGGEVTSAYAEIPLEITKPVQFEESFTGHYPVGRRSLGKVSTTEVEFDFSGVGFALTGNVRKSDPTAKETEVRAVLYIDGKRIEEVAFPTVTEKRRTDLFWRYQLPDSLHKVQIKVINPDPKYELVAVDLITYGSSPYHVHKKSD